MNWLGHVLIDNVDLEIGGQRIDKHYGTWLHIWNELTQTPGHALGYANMVGNNPELTSLKVAQQGDPDIVVPSQVLYIPLQFFFCRNPGLALPLIALQYHEVKINLQFREVKDCFWAGKKTTGAWTRDNNILMNGTPSLSSASLFVDYIYLDTDERRRFAQVSHEYLIEQLQFTGDEATSQSQNRIKLNFNHPTKELIWVVQKDEYVDDVDGALLGRQWFNFTDKLIPPWTLRHGHHLLKLVPLVVPIG